MPAAREVRHVILGTAGHIDHGKTTLVERLTGTWADRLPEEQARGMTIDLGYAAFPLADGTEVGLLDVPGHESFVHTMVAGASVMDLALLVVAADDGPMLQTHEHVQILDVLGVTRLVVALTKIDLVDSDTADLAEAEVRELVDSTGMSGAPVVRVSSATGEGIDELKRVLLETLPRVAERKDDGRVFRMPVLRGFLVPGRGAVVTGVPISGRVVEGDRVEDLEGRVDRIIGIESRGFLFGMALAVLLGVGFVPVRKPGKLPAATIEESYSLEYGVDRLQIHEDAVAKGERVIIVDDLLATGGTASATCALIERLGGEVAACLFLIELDGLGGRGKLEGRRVESILHY